MNEQESASEQPKSVDWFIAELQRISAEGTDINTESKRAIISELHKPIQEGMFNDEDKARLASAIKSAEPFFEESDRQLLEDNRHFLEHPESGQLS